jgi:hypothetical protein
MLVEFADIQIKPGQQVSFEAAVCLCIAANISKGERISRLAPA